jgi:MFS family permease
MKTIRHTLVLLVIIYFAYISLGLPDTVLGIAWPYMSSDFGKPLEAVGFLTIFTTCCTVLSSVLSGHILARFGTGRVTFVSCLMTACGLIGYSLAPSMAWLFVFLPLLGFGAGCIDCGLNMYVASHYSSRHMTWLHSCWGIGATVGPMIMTAFLASGLSWRGGYRTIGSIQLTLAVVLFASIGLWDRVRQSRVDGPGNSEGAGDAEATRGDDAVHGIITATRDGGAAAPDGEETKRRRRAAMRLQIAFFALYTACEFLVGVWAFSLLVKARGVEPTLAGLWVSFFYAALTGGRILSGFIVDRFGNRFMIRAGVVVSFFGIGLLALPSILSPAFDALACAGLILMGVGFAPMYPSMMHETPKRFRESTARKMVGYQTGAANLGASILPAFIGLVGARTSLEVMPIAELAFMLAMLAIGFALDSLTAREPL